jgi:hypothetical protein
MKLNFENVSSLWLLQNNTIFYNLNCFVGNAIKLPATVQGRLPSGRKLIQRTDEDKPSAKR